MFLLIVHKSVAQQEDRNEVEIRGIHQSLTMFLAEFNDVMPEFVRDVFPQWKNKQFLITSNHLFQSTF